MIRETGFFTPLWEMSSCACSETATWCRYPQATPWMCWRNSRSGTGRLSREDALVMLENHRLYNYLGQDSFKDIEIFDRPISLQRGDIIVLMSDGLYELIPWKEIEDVLSGGQDCQSMAYALMEKVNQNSAEDRDNASVILLRWDGSTT